jgi:DNA-binding MarR family transcriptional regulator
MAGRRTPEGKAGTDVILATFRTNGLIVSAGDRLGAEEGLTSARWQVLGAIALEDRPMTVPQIARRMGLTRQSVHVTTKALIDAGLLELAPNADHRRSPLVAMTELGRTTYDAVDRLQTRWVNELVDGIARSDLETAARVLEELSRRLESSATPDERSGTARRSAR